MASSATASQMQAHIAATTVCTAALPQAGASCAIGLNHMSTPAAMR